MAADELPDSYTIEDAVGTDLGQLSIAELARAEAILDGAVTAPAIGDYEYAIVDTAANASGKTGLGEQAVSITALAAGNDYNFSGHDNGTISVSSDVDLSVDEVTFGSVTIEVAAGNTLTITAAQATAMAKAGGKIVGEGRVDITDLDGTDIYDLSAVEAATVIGQVTATATLRGDTELGDAAVHVASGQTLTLSAAQATGRDIYGPGSAVVEVTGSGTYDFSKVTTTGDDTEIEVSGTVTLGAGTNLGSVETALKGNAELTITAATAHGKTITGDNTGKITITGSQTNADFSKIKNEIKLDVTGVTGTISKLPGWTSTEFGSVGAGAELTLTAAQATGKTIDGAGTVEITALSGLVDLSDIAAGTVNAIASTSQALQAGSQLGNAVVTIEEGVTLTANATTVHTKDFSGKGTLLVTGTATADLSGVDSSLNTTNHTGGTLTMPGSVAAGNTLTMTADQADEKSIGGEGNVTVTALGSDVADLFNIDSDGDLIAIVTGSPTLDAGTHVNGFEVQVGSGQTLTLTHNQAAAAAKITGAGNVVVTIDADAAVDLAHVEVGGSITLNVTEDVVNLSSEDVTFGDNDVTISIAAGKVLVLGAAQSAMATAIVGEGTLAVMMGDDDVDVDFAHVSLSGGGKLIAVVNDDKDVTDIDFAKVDEISFVGLWVLTIDAAQLSGKTVENGWDIFIAASGTLAADTDLDGGTAVKLAQNVVLTAPVGVVDGLEIFTTETGASLVLTGAAADATVGGWEELTANLDISAVTGTAAEVHDALGGYQLLADRTLTLDAAHAHELDTSGFATTDGTIAITGNASGRDFNDIGTHLDLRNATIDGDTKLPGDGALGAGQILHLNAADADGLTITGTDTSKVMLHGSATDVDLSGIGIDLDITNAELSGTTTWPDSGSLAAGQVLTLTAAQAHMQVLVATGAGSEIKITKLHESPDANFSDISVVAGTATAAFDVTGPFNRALNGVEVTVAEGATMTISATNANGQTIEGAGGVVITGQVSDNPLLDDISTDFQSITAATVDLSASTTFFQKGTGLVHLPGGTGVNYDGGTNPLVTTLTDQTLILNAAVANELDDTGSTGSKIVIKSTTAHADLDFSDIRSDLDITGANLTGTIVWPDSDGGGAGLVAGQKLYATATQMHGEDIDAADHTAKVILSGEYDGSFLNLVDVADAASIDVSQVVTDASILFNTGGDKLDLNDKQTITLTAAQAHGQKLNAADNADSKIIIKDLDQKLNANLAGMTTEGAGTVTAEFNTSGTFTGSLSADMTVKVKEGATMTISAAKADGMTLAGQDATNANPTGGSVVITDLGTASVDLGNITAGTDDGNDARSAGTVTTTVSSNLEPHASSVLGDLAITVNSGATLTLNATAHINGRTIDGDGKVVIKSGVDIDGLSLVNITADLDISAATNGPDTDELPGYDGDTGVLTGQTLTMTAAQATTKAIEGTGDVVVKDLGATAADLSDIDVDGTMTVHVPETAALDGDTDLGKFAVVVAEDAVLTLSAAQADGLSITGAGSVEITGNAEDIDLSGIATDIEFTGTNADKATFPTLTADQTVSGTAEKLDGATIAGAGTVEVSDLHSTLDADLRDLTAETVTAVFGGSGIFDGHLGSAVVDVTAGTLTTAAAKANGKTIEGAGNVELTDYTGGVIDLTGITVTGDKTITIDDFDGSVSAEAKLGDFTLEIDGDSIVTVPVSIADGLSLASTARVYITGEADDADLSGISAGGAGIFDITGVTGAIDSLPATWSNGTLVLTAAQADGITMDVQSGTVRIIDLHDVPEADLSGITGAAIEALFDLTAYNATDVNFAGQLSSDVNVVVGFGAILYVEADTVAAKTVTGTGTVAVVESVVADGDFRFIEANLDLSLVDLTGVTRLPGNGHLFADQVLTIDVSEIHGETITGAAGATIVPVGAIENGNFHGISASLDLTQVELSGTTILPNRQGTGADHAVTRLADDQVLTLTAEQAAVLIHGKVVSDDPDAGKIPTDGQLVIVGDVAGFDFSKVETNLDLSGADLSAATKLPGHQATPLVQVRLDDDQKLTLDVNDVAGKIFQEKSAGNSSKLEITGELQGTLDLTSAEIDVDVSFKDNEVDLAEGASLTAYDTQVDGIDVNGAGSLRVENNTAGNYSITLGEDVQASIEFAEVDLAGGPNDNQWSIDGFNAADVLDFNVIASEDGLSNTTFQQYAKGATIDAGVLAIATDLVVDSSAGGSINAGDVETFFAQSGTAGLGRALNQDLAADSQMIFILSDSVETGDDSHIWYWDDAAGNGDGIVDTGELTLIGTLNNFNAHDIATLTADNFII